MVEEISGDRVRSMPIFSAETQKGVGRRENRGKENMFEETQDAQEPKQRIEQVI